jgi:isocitrate dehydrogenase
LTSFIPVTGTTPIKKRIRESNGQLRDYLHRIMERKEENLRNFASLESGE